jgi:hypothetical protein
MLKDVLREAPVVRRVERVERCIFLDYCWMNETSDEKLEDDDGETSCALDSQEQMPITKPTVHSKLDEDPSWLCPRSAVCRPQAAQHVSLCCHSPSRRRHLRPQVGA